MVVIDESHQTMPQIRGMFNGDQARKRTLVEYGFRLPSAMGQPAPELSRVRIAHGTDHLCFGNARSLRMTKSGGEVIEQSFGPPG